MSTNYYWHTEHDEPQHICKSLVMFKASFLGEWAVSWQDWKKRLQSGGRVINEYGEVLDTDQFLADVEATTPEHRRRQYDWCVAHRGELGVGDIDVVGSNGEWLDADGFSFGGREFS